VLEELSPPLCAVSGYLLGSPAGRSDMKAFLKEYWLWIVIPFVLVAGAVLVAVLMMSDDGASPFVYNIY